MYYYYPRELADTDFGEVYAKLTWVANDWLTLGAYAYYAPDWLNTGATGTYVGGTAKVTLPSSYLASGWGAYASAELAGYFFGTSPIALLTDYTYWNAGIGLTYKAFTVDFRYHDTDLNRGQCSNITGDFRVGGSKWCSSAFIAKLSVDTTMAALK
jgi:hypothetical protein